MKKVSLVLLLLLAATLNAAISNPSGIVLNDLHGKTWDIDAMLNEGKHIAIVSTGSR